MTDADTRTWIVLLLLTGLAFALGERGGTAVLALAAGKFGLVAWQFMDLRHAARIWSAVLLVLLVCTLTAVVALR
mgnify:FL=1